MVKRHFHLLHPTQRNTIILHFGSGIYHKNAGAGVSQLRYLSALNSNFSQKVSLRNSNGWPALRTKSFQ